MQGGGGRVQGGGGWGGVMKGQYWKYGRGVEVGQPIRRKQMELAWGGGQGGGGWGGSCRDSRGVEGRAAN